MVKQSTKRKKKPIRRRTSGAGWSLWRTLVRGLFKAAREAKREIDSTRRPSPARPVSRPSGRPTSRPGGRPAGGSGGGAGRRMSAGAGGGSGRDSFPVDPVEHGPNAEFWTPSAREPGDPWGGSGAGPVQSGGRGSEQGDPFADPWDQTQPDDDPGDPGDDEADADGSDAAAGDGADAAGGDAAGDAA